MGKKFGLFLVMIALIGCVEVKEKRIEIENGLDDGSIVVLSDLLPDIAAGFLYGDSEGILVGVGVSGGGDNITSRGIYRFNISNVENASLHLKCLSKQGEPGKLEVYVIDDFGRLPSVSSENPEDVTEIWNLVKNGTKIGEVIPKEGEWFSIKIPSNVLKGKYIVFMLKISDESLEGNNMYQLITYEYAIAHKEKKPYLEIE